MEQLGGDIHGALACRTDTTNCGDEQTIVRPRFRVRPQSSWTPMDGSVEVRRREEPAIRWSARTGTARVRLI